MARPRNKCVTCGGGDACPGHDTAQREREASIPGASKAVPTEGRQPSPTFRLTHPVHSGIAVRDIPACVVGVHKRVHLKECRTTGPVEEVVLIGALLVRSVPVASIRDSDTCAGSCADTVQCSGNRCVASSYGWGGMSRSSNTRRVYDRKGAIPWPVCRADGTLSKDGITGNGRDKTWSLTDGRNTARQSTGFSKRHRRRNRHVP